jgi:hypothetical protein
MNFSPPMAGKTRFEKGKGYQHLLREEESEG